MASFSVNGLDEFQLSLREIAQLPDNVVEEMLDAGAEVAVQAHKRKLRSLRLVDTQKLVNSIKAHKKLRVKDGLRKRYVLVYPTGKHGTYHRKEVTKVYKNSRHGRTYTVGGDVKTVTNNDVGFVHEFGAPKRGIPAKQWMKQANEECADEVERVEFEVYDRYLKSKNL